MEATDAQKCRSKKITTDDLKKYKKILELTNAHLTSYQPVGDIQIRRGAKYREVIAPLFSHTRRARGEHVSPAVAEVATNLTAYYFPPFPYSLSATILLFIHHYYTISPHDGATISSPEGNFHFSQLAPMGHFHYSLLASLKISNMAPEGNFPYSQLATLTISNMAPEGRESRDLGSGGGNFILGETITSPGICLTTYYLR